MMMLVNYLYLITCISTCSIVLGNTQETLETDEENPDFLCRCNPHMTCPASSNINVTAVVKAMLDLRINNIFNRMSEIEKTNEQLTDDIKKLKGEGIENMWEVRRCGLDTESSLPDRVVIDAKFGRTAEGLCQLIGSKVVPGLTYTISADMFNKQGWKGVNSGHPGIIFNAQNSKNYDVFYFRPHATSSCYQAGYINGGTWGAIKQGPCPNGPPKGGQWFNVKVKVNGFSVEVFLNGLSVLKYVPHFPASGRGGVEAWNGYSNIVLVKNFTVSASE